MKDFSNICHFYTKSIQLRFDSDLVRFKKMPKETDQKSKFQTPATFMRALCNFIRPNVGDRDRLTQVDGKTVTQSFHRRGRCLHVGEAS